jgi:hypothetical protein
MAERPFSTEPARSLRDVRSHHPGVRREDSPECRRWFLRLVALAGASGLALVAARPALTHGAQFDLASAKTDDVANLRLLLDLEHLAYALYREAAIRFGEVPGDDLTTSLHRSVLPRVREHEGDHVGLLTALLVERDGPLAAVATYDFGYSDERGFVQVATHIENALVGAYVHVLPAINEPFLHRVLTSLLAVEARHAAYFGGQSGEPAFPQAREGAASKIASLLVIDRYLVT